MDYTNDVFISYKRDPFKDEWLSDHFMPLFSYYVREEITAACGRLPQRIFFDQTEISPATRKFDQHGIEPGQEWRTALEAAIRTSRCLVALWSPLYFYSDWCLTEWASFRSRAGSGHSLVIPMSVHDGEAFPEPARNLQAPDFSDFVIIGSGFRKTKAYSEFQHKLRRFAGTVAASVAKAPPFNNFPLTAVSGPSESVPNIPQQRL